MRIVLIIVTYNRRKSLEGTLRAVMEQTRRPDDIVVVDNGSTDETLSLLAEDFPNVDVLHAGDNPGYGTALTLGMRSYSEPSVDAYWLMDDDSRPVPDCLAQLERAATEVPSASVVASRGGTLKWGLIRHLKEPAEIRRRPCMGSQLYAVDFMMIDGALVRRPVVDAVGYPRSDLFLMFEDVEYGYRIHRAGLQIGVLGRDLMVRDSLGKHGEGSGRKPLWRRYYKTRNHVRVALESGSAVFIAGCLVRQVRYFAQAAFARDRRGTHLRMLASGIRDGVRGRMGRTVEPGEV